MSSVSKTVRGGGGIFPRPVRHQDLFVLLFILVLVLAFTSLFLELIPWTGTWGTLQSTSRPIEEITLDDNSPVAEAGDSKCNLYTCLNVYRCGRMAQPYTLSVYVYPLTRFLHSKGKPVFFPMSREYKALLDAVMDSEYYTEDPSKACLFVPPIDTLNQNRLPANFAGQALNSLPFWSGGENHLLFNFIPGSLPNFSSVLDIPRGRAIVAGGGFSTWTYRRMFDVSIPIYNPLITPDLIKTRNPISSSRKHFVVSTQTNLHREFIQDLLGVADEHPELLVLEKCTGHLSSNHTKRCHGDDVFDYPQILHDSTFCLMIRGARLGQMVLLDAIMSDCIPVVIADGYVLPFSEVLDWKRAAVLIYEDDIPDIMAILKSISDDKIVEMRTQVHFLYRTYMSSMKSIVTSTLHILNDRLFPHMARSYEQWNDPPFMGGVRSPLFLPMIAPRVQGFTAVILTYDRLDSLFQVIQNVVKAPSLTKVLVVWNNQNKPPPQASMWPKINKPLKVVQTLENKLSNRFYPYDEIETEAILAIDDDIVMLTSDELEFGFEVWREFPDRIVGFPSRVHLWDNNTRLWKYQSEWTNHVSMVLTGVAFYHKFWSYMYTTKLPKAIRSWVDEHMNCEDIAMNFLVTNMTGKSPIKVAPRKKFKCPECVNAEMLSTDLSHMLERSNCINRFAEIFGVMPLKPVEFRADPVLYKDNFPEKLKRFNNIGSL